MIKKLFLIIGLLFTINSFAQKAQKIGYIDMQYILENVPEYVDAQLELTKKANKWRADLDQKKNEITSMKEALANERALLTNDLIEEKEEEIQIKQEELTTFQNNYFGANGDLFSLRKQLARPVQDRIYNAVQEIAKAKKFDFIFDKSSDLIMLHSNKRFDVSDLVLQRINRSIKLDEVKDKRAKKKAEAVQLSDAAKKKQEDRAAKKAALQERLKKQREEKAKKREELRKQLEEKRKARIKAREEALKKRSEDKKKKTKEEEKQ